MKHINLLVLLLISLQSVIYTAEEFQQEFKPSRQQIIDDAVKNFPNVVEGLDFLRTKYPVILSFRDFLDNNLSHDDNEDEEPNIGELITNSMDFIVDQMKYSFVSIFHQEIRTRIVDGDFNVIQYSIFLYVMKYKDGFMKCPIENWMHELNQINERTFWPTLLYRAVRINNICIVKFLIDKGVDLNTQDCTGWSPLYYAVYHNKIECISLLIDAGANVNIQSKYGKTPLHEAVRKNNIHVVQMLIDAGADLTIKDLSGYTPVGYIRTFEMLVVLNQVKCCTIS